MIFDSSENRLQIKALSIFVFILVAKNVLYKILPFSCQPSVRMMGRMDEKLTLRNLRIRLDLPQKAISADSGVAQDILSRIESGRVNPSTREVRRIAKAMGVSEKKILSCLKVQGSRVWGRRSGK